jgi:metal-responsive CopG/Arc/MetJ family transcriptional regulator
MRTTINIPEDIIKEAEALYDSKNRSKVIEAAIRDAVRIKKLEKFKSLKGRISFDESAIENFRGKSR